MLVTYPNQVSYRMEMPYRNEAAGARNAPQRPVLGAVEHPETASVVGPTLASDPNAPVWGGPAETKMGRALKAALEKAAHITPQSNEEILRSIAEGRERTH